MAQTNAVKAGVDAYQRGDFAGAIKDWQAPAAQGDADAQFNLGQAYRLGKGVPVDLAKAEDYYRRAAEQGHFQAEDNYGRMLFQKGERAKAAPWLEKSAARGDPRGQLILGTMLFNGDGGLKANPVEGLMWLTVASRRAVGTVDAQWIDDLLNADMSIATPDARKQSADMADSLEQQFASIDALP